MDPNVNFQPMNDAEFVAEVRRHMIAIAKAFVRRYGVDLFHSPSLQSSGNLPSTELPGNGPFSLDKENGNGSTIKSCR